MNRLTRVTSLLAATMFSVAVLFSGAASAAHCDHPVDQPDPWEVYDEYNR